MTVRRAAEVAAAWERNHGPASRASEFTAIAMSESSLDDAAVSPADALGIWQIMPFWFAHFGYPTAEYRNLDIQAVMTIAISGLGTNCAAWDSCYRDIYRSGRHAFLGWPEEGSAAFANIPVADVATGQGGAGVPHHDRYPGVTATIEATLADFGAMSGRHLPRLALSVARQQARISRQFYPRMR